MPCCATSPTPARRRSAMCCRAISAAVPATYPSCRRRWPPGSALGRSPMLDLGTSFLASVARDPRAIAIVDGDVRLTYGEWLRKISAVVAGLDAQGLRRGDHLATVLQNRWQTATLHWACQFSGIILTPLNWRVQGDELGYCLAHPRAAGLGLLGRGPPAGGANAPPAAPAPPPP